MSERCSDISSLSKDCKAAADRLYTYLAANYVSDDGALIGPDAGVRFNLRVGRFLRSYLPFLPWKDDAHYYLQGQGYWILSNVRYFEHTGDSSYLNAALHCADVIVERQSPGGYWVYDNPEWAGRIATVDGCFGGLGLLAAYRASGEERYLEAAKRWYDYMIESVGFKKYDAESLSLNYFSNYPRGMVPNNSTLGLWFSAEMKAATGDEKYLAYTDEMLSFVSKCQLESGELPYILASEQGSTKVHYLCYQYHAYQLLDLVKYHSITQDERAARIIVKITDFLKSGLTAAGDAKYDCSKNRPTVHYYTAALAEALLTADKAGFGDCGGYAIVAYQRLLSKQRPDGAFDYSQGNYLLLSDKRSYPRNLVMILYHLLLPGF